MPPVLATPHHYLISIYRNELYFVAVLQKEGDSLMCVFVCDLLSMYVACLVVGI